MADILVIGYGFVGSRLTPMLAGAGHNVTVLRRSSVAVASGAKLRVADITRRETLAALPASDLVVFAAAPRSGSEAAYRALYLGGVRNLLRVYAEAGQPTRWLFVSSTSVYGQQDGSWVDEDSPTEPLGFRGEVMLQAEKAVLEGGRPGCVVRCAGIYGPGRDRLLRKVWDGAPVPVEPPYYTNRIHAEDCAAFLAFLVAKMLAGELVESVYLASDDAPAPIAEVSCWLAEKMGRPSPPAGLPHGEVSQNKRCRNDHMKAAGFRSRYPGYRDGYKPMIQPFLDARQARAGGDV